MDPTAIAAGLAAVEATPIALVAIVKANVLNTSRLAVINFIAAIPVCRLSQIGGGPFRDQ